MAVLGHRIKSQFRMAMSKEILDRLIPAAFVGEMIFVFGSCQLYIHVMAMLHSSPSPYTGSSIRYRRLGTGMGLGMLNVHLLLTVPLVAFSTQIDVKSTHVLANQYFYAWISSLNRSVTFPSFHHLYLSHIKSVT